MKTPTIRRRPTPLEVAMLDELRHVFLMFKERWITPKNFALVMGDLRTIITQAEKEISDEV